MAKKLYGTDPDQVPTNADLGTMAYQDKDNVHLNGRVVISAVNPAPFTVPNASESLEINDGSTTKLLMYADNSNAYIQASKYDGTNPGRTLIFATKQGTDGIAAESARFNVSGNLEFPNGQGIDFSASEGGSASSSVLSDYETGTWTPEFTSSTDAADNVTNSKDGYYIKVGRQVYIFADLVGNDLSGITGTDQVTVEGLPYALQGTSNGNDHGISFAGFRYLLTTDHTGMIQNQSGVIKFTTDGFAAATYTTLFQYPASASTFIRFSATYYSSS